MAKHIFPPEEAKKMVIAFMKNEYNMHVEPDGVDFLIQRGPKRVSIAIDSDVLGNTISQQEALADYPIEALQAAIDNRATEDNNEDEDEDENEDVDKDSDQDTNGEGKVEDTVEDTVEAVPDPTDKVEEGDDTGSATAESTGENAPNEVVQPGGFGASSNTSTRTETPLNNDPSDETKEPVGTKNKFKF